MIYLCIKCKKKVDISRVTFIHPHLGSKTCFVCIDCHNMVYLKDEDTMLTNRDRV